MDATGTTMPTAIEALEAQVLSLPTPERSRLLDKLILSLDSDIKVEEAWKTEAKRRDDEIESGDSEELALDDVLAKLRAGLR